MTEHMTETDIIVDFMKTCTVEVTPGGAAKIESFPEILRAGTTVYVTFLPGSDFADTVKTVRRLRDEGMAPVPHFAARSIPSRDFLEENLKMLQGECAVEEALLIGGGVDNPVGEFHCSMQVLETGLFEKYGIKKLGVAGHPEGSPDISSHDIADAIRQKNDFARETNAEMALVTQFAFNAETMITWAEKLAAEGNTLPVHLGLAGPAKLTTLLKYAAMCGVGASLGFLKKRAGAIAALTTSYSPDQMMDPIEAYWQANPDGPVAQVHVFPFGGLKKTAEYLTERGNWFDAPVADNNNDPAQQEVVQ